MFVMTTKGREMPVNTETEQVMVPQPNGVYHVVRGHVSHFATCPDADGWRKRS